MWSGSQSPVPLPWHRPEHWLTACRLRAALPAWLKSGRSLHLDEQSFSFFSCLAKFWLVLPSSKAVSVYLRAASFVAERGTNEPDEKLMCPLDNVQASNKGGTLWLLGKGAKEAYKGLRSCINVYFWKHQKKLLLSYFFTAVVAVLARMFGPCHCHPD